MDGFTPRCRISRCSGGSFVFLILLLLPGIGSPSILSHTPWRLVNKEEEEKPSCVALCYKNLAWLSQQSKCFHLLLEFFKIKSFFSNVMVVSVMFNYGSQGLSETLATCSSMYPESRSCWSVNRSTDTLYTIIVQLYGAIDYIHNDYKTIMAHEAYSTNLSSLFRVDAVHVLNSIVVLSVRTGTIYLCHSRWFWS